MAFGYIFGPYTTGPTGATGPAGVAGAPPAPLPGPPVPKKGDIWEVIEGDTIIPAGTQVHIVFVGSDGSVLGEDVGGTRDRIWDNYSQLQAAWKLVTKGPESVVGINKSEFPHVCPRCTMPAYVGGGPSDIDCSNSFCSTKNTSMMLDRIGVLR